MSNLLLDERPLLVMPKLAVLIGLPESIFLQQLHYWTEHSSNVVEGKKWVYNSVNEWQKQFPFWSARTIHRIIRDLENENLIVSGSFNKLAIDRTKWYRINYEKLHALEPKQTISPYGQTYCQVGNMDSPKVVDGLDSLAVPLPEITTKTTTKTTSNKKNSRKQVFDDNSDEMKLATFFISEIKKNSADFKLPNLQSWCEEFRRIIELDKRNKSEIFRLIRWVQADDFEKANVLSPIKLRKRYDALKIRMLNPTKPKRVREEKVPDWFYKQDEPVATTTEKDPAIDAERQRLLKELGVKS
ncbi:hypothetical protein [Psychrobacillus sp.]|uniref:hypothetical protein n=1 Tax=Psychrobacillus sp. TaxID=1871623 RepID=UPI0028BD6D3D|nr:hypothetical protein [Psychrobacillus sp.]